VMQYTSLITGVRCSVIDAARPRPALNRRVFPHRRVRSRVSRALPASTSLYHSKLDPGNYVR
jgi:hypothetical protein